MAPVCLSRLPCRILAWLAHEAARTRRTMAAVREPRSDGEADVAAVAEATGMCALGGTSMSDVPGNVDDHHAALTLEQQQRGHQFAIMVMQKVMVPAALH
jgi:hypothetical protein